MDIVIINKTCTLLPKVSESPLKRLAKLKNSSSELLDCENLRFFIMDFLAELFLMLEFFLTDFTIDLILGVSNFMFCVSGVLTTILDVEIGVLVTVLLADLLTLLLRDADFGVDIFSSIFLGVLTADFGFVALAGRFWLLAFAPKLMRGIFETLREADNFPVLFGLLRLPVFFGADFPFALNKIQ